MLPTSTRLLRLLSLLQSRRHWSGRDLSERLEIDQRTVRRDVDRLRELGKPFEEYRYDAGHGSLVVDERIKQVALEIDFVARHLGTPSPRP